MTRSRRAGPRHRRLNDADKSLTALYHAHYRALTVLAAVLTDDIAVAEDVAQAAFAATHATWRSLRGDDRAVAYLLQAVVLRSRSYRRHGREQHRPGLAESAASQGIAPGDALILALRSLPNRQREALTLRCLAGLPDAEIAAAMGTGVRAVRLCLLRAMAAVQAAADAVGQIAGDAGTSQDGRPG